MSDLMARVPAGVPAGGQFAAMVRSESGVELSAPSAEASPHWIYVEREAKDGKHLMVGPYGSEAAAVAAMEDSLLIQGIAEDGATDIWTTGDQPGDDDVEQVLINPNDPDHHGGDLSDWVAPGQTRVMTPEDHSYLLLGDVVLTRSDDGKTFTTAAQFEMDVTDYVRWRRDIHPDAAGKYADHIASNVTEFFAAKYGAQATVAPGGAATMSIPIELDPDEHLPADTVHRLIQDTSAPDLFRALARKDADIYSQLHAWIEMPREGTYVHRDASGQVVDANAIDLRDPPEGWVTEWSATGRSWRVTSPDGISRQYIRSHSDEPARSAPWAQ